jgi:hypothetical protein
MAIWVARGYRTISFEAATVLARFPPFDILAKMDARVYDQTRIPRRVARGEQPDINKSRGVNASAPSLLLCRAYLGWRGREETAQCRHCDCDRDSAQHTVENCLAWMSERRVLVAKIWQDLCPSTVVEAMLTDSEG